MTRFVYGDHTNVEVGPYIRGFPYSTLHFELSCSGFRSNHGNDPPEWVEVNSPNDEPYFLALRDFCRTFDDDLASDFRAISRIRNRYAHLCGRRLLTAHSS